MEGLIRLSTRLGAAAVIGGIGVNTCLFDVPGGYRAVVFDRFQGVMKKTYKEGTHPMIPFLQVPVGTVKRTHLPPRPSSSPKLSPNRSPSPSQIPSPSRIPSPVSSPRPMPKPEPRTQAQAQQAKTTS